MNVLLIHLADFKKVTDGVTRVLEDDIEGLKVALGEVAVAGGGIGGDDIVLGVVED